MSASPSYMVITLSLPPHLPLSSPHLNPPHPHQCIRWCPLLYPLLLFVSALVPPLVVPPLRSLPLAKEPLLTIYLYPSSVVDVDEVVIHPCLSRLSLIHPYLHFLNVAKTLVASKRISCVEPKQLWWTTVTCNPHEVSTFWFVPKCRH